MHISIDNNWRITKNDRCWVIEKRTGKVWRGRHWLTSFPAVLRHITEMKLDEVGGDANMALPEITALFGRIKYLADAIESKPRRPHLEKYI